MASTSGSGGCATAPSETPTEEMKSSVGVSGIEPVHSLNAKSPEPEINHGPEDAENYDDCYSDLELSVEKENASASDQSSRSAGTGNDLVGEDHIVPDLKIGAQITELEITEAEDSISEGEIYEDCILELPAPDLSAIQISQWSLVHRINVCKACVEDNHRERRVMTPLSSNEYEKQSWALVNSAVQSKRTVSDDSFSSVHWSNESWESKISELQENLDSLILQINWKDLTTQLEAKLSSVRECDKKEPWYNVFVGKDFQPWNIYKAVEEEEFESFKTMMVKIGVEHWEVVKPGEYKGATPLHWAVLHGREEMVSFMRDNAKAMPGKELALVNACDGFGFTPLHMASFSWLIIQGLSEEEDAKRCSRIAAILLDINGRGSSCASSKASHSNFLIFTEATSACFVAKHCLSSSVHPIQLAIWFAHPRVVKRLMSTLQKEAFVVTGEGDTILHLAAWGINKHHGKVMTLLLRYLYLSPDSLNRGNKDKQTPLHIAVFQGKYECVAALFRCYYTKVTTKNRKSFTPLLIATELEKSYAGMNHGKRVFAWSLGREDDYGKKFGVSTLNLFKYNDENGIQNMLSEAYTDSQRATMTQIIDMIQRSFGLDKKLLRHREILQISQWSIKHRMLALWMFDDKEAESELKTGVYEEQYWKLAETLCQGMDGFKEVTSVEQLRFGVTSELKKLGDEFLKPCSDHAMAKKLQPIYCAIEEGDLDEFKRKMLKLPKKHWSESLREYRDATPLHWAALYGRKEMVSFIRKEIFPSDKTSMMIDMNEVEGENWSAIKDAQDAYGFTPIHLAVLSLHSPWLKQAKWPTEKEDEIAKNCADLIEELYQISVLSCLNKPRPKKSHLNFIGWNLWDYRHAEDHDFINIELYPIHLGVWFAHPLVATKLLTRWSSDAFVKTSKEDTTLHCATWNDNVVVKKLKHLKPLLLKHDLPSNVVNACNEKRQTPLHNAVHIKSPEWVEALLGCDHINVNLRNQDGYTPRELAAVKLLEGSLQAAHQDRTVQNLFYCFSDGASESKVEDPLEKIIYLIDCKDPAGLYRETEALQKERQVYVDAANAILVGAALIASASFGAWLQPPLGYKEYYSHDFLVQGGAAPPDTYEAFVAIKQYWIIHLFWVFNSLSFFFSLATVIAGADAALPQQGLKVKEAVTSVQKAVKRASFLLSMAILFVIGTFTTVGFAIIPHIEKYRINMYCTLIVGLSVCTFTLIRLLEKLSPNVGSAKSTSRVRGSIQQKYISFRQKPSRIINRGLSMVVERRKQHQEACSTAAGT